MLHPKKTIGSKGMTKGINSAVENTQEVINLLEKHAGQPDNYISDLNGQILKIETGNVFEKKQALKHIAGLTHPKCLGDVHMKDYPWRDWSKVLDKLRQKCIRAFNQLEKQ